MRLLTAFLILFSYISFSLAAQTEDSARNIEVKWKEGKEYHFKTKIALYSQSGSDMPPMVIESPLDVKVESVKGDGTASLVLTKKMIFPAFAKAGQTPSTSIKRVTINNKGRVIGGDNVRSTMAFGSLLPNKPVKKGDSWKPNLDELGAITRFGLTWGAQAQCTYKGIEKLGNNQVAHIDVKFIKKSGSKTKKCGGGKLLVDTKDGLVRSLNFDITNLKAAFSKKTVPFSKIILRMSRS